MDKEIMESKGEEAWTWSLQVKEAIGTFFLGMFALGLLIALIRSEARYRALITELMRR